VPGAAAQPVTLQRAMAHYMNGQNNPLLANESQSYLKMAGMDAEQRDRLESAKALRDQADALRREKLARDDANFKAKEIADAKHEAAVLTDRKEGREFNATLAKTLKGMGSSGNSGFSGAAPSIGTNDKGAPVYRSSKSGTVFTFDENGEPQVHKGPIKSLASSKPLPSSVHKELSAAEDNAGSMTQLESTFKPEFAGAKGTLSKTLGPYIPGVSDDAAQWWKTYAKQSELVERHKLFGAALTPVEQESWRAADISSGMKADTIKANLAIRKALADKVFANSVDRYSKDGYPQVKDVFNPSTPRGTGVGAPPTVSNAEDYAKIPSGSRYTDPTGTVRTKP